MYKWIALSVMGIVFLFDTFIHFLNTKSRPIPENVKDISVSRSRVYVLGRENLYEYDYAGNLTKETKPMGTVVNSYDSFGNLTSVAAQGSTQPTSTYSYNAIGLRTSMTDDTGTTTYAYDGFGNLTTETKGDIIKTSTYDVMGRRLTLNITNNGTTLLNNSLTTAPWGSC